MNGLSVFYWVSLPLTRSPSCTSPKAHCTVLWFWDVQLAPASLLASHAWYPVEEILNLMSSNASLFSFCNLIQSLLFVLLVTLRFIIHVKMLLMLVAGYPGPAVCLPCQLCASIWGAACFVALCSVSISVCPGASPTLPATPALGKFFISRKGHDPTLPALQESVGILLLHILGKLV